MHKKNIAILEMGSAGEILEDKHGSFANMIEAWLQPNLPNAAFTGFRVFENEALPDDSQFDGFILTGSPYGVYEEHAWLDGVRHYLKVLSRKHIPIFGICFGHQLLAQTFGAIVEKSYKGWGVGTQNYSFKDKEVKDSHVYLFHQDQVLSKPISANVIGGSEFCPMGILEYEFPALSVQFHPEFTQDFMCDLLEKKKALLGEEAQQNQFKNSLQQSVDNTVFSKWVADFFNQYSKK